MFHPLWKDNIIGDMRTTRAKHHMNSGNVPTLRMIAPSGAEEPFAQLGASGLTMRLLASKMSTPHRILASQRDATRGAANR
jgi:hypothetical protein